MSVCARESERRESVYERESVCERERGREGEIVSAACECVQVRVSE